MTRNDSPCPKSCCWSPFQICARRHECNHHQVDEAVHQFQAELSAAAEISRYAHLKAGPR